MGDSLQPDTQDETSSPDSQSLIHLIIKTAKEKETIDISSDASIEDVSQSDVMTSSDESSSTVKEKSGRKVQNGTSVRLPDFCRKDPERHGDSGITQSVP